MSVHELESLLLRSAVLDELPHRPEPVRPVAVGDLTRILEVGRGIPLRQGVQTHEDANAGDAARVEHRHRPRMSMWTDQTRAMKQVARAPLDG